MKKYLCQFLVVVFVCSMLFSNSMYARAASPKETHQCAFSYIGVHEVSRMQVSTHQYLAYNDKTQNYEYKECRIYNVVMEKVYKCGCGKTKTERYSQTVHSAMH